MIGVTISIVVSLSRVMLGVHYPSDVLAGWFAVDSILKVINEFM